MMHFKKEKVLATQPVTMIECLEKDSCENPDLNPKSEYHPSPSSNSRCHFMNCSGLSSITNDSVDDHHLPPDPRHLVLHAPTELGGSLTLQRHVFISQGIYVIPDENKIGINRFLYLVVMITG